MDRALSTLASLLRPVDPGRRLVAVDTDERWTRAEAIPDRAREAATIAWGRAAAPSGTPLPRAMRSGLRRELALAAVRLRPPDGFRVREVHRLGPQRAGTGSIRRRVRRAVLGGAVVELTRDPGAPRLVDRVLDDVGGLDRVSALRISSGGAALVTGRDRSGRVVVVRLAPQGGASDPGGAAGALRALGAAALPQVPRLLDEGVTLGISWTVESLLPGRRPDRVSPALANQVATMLARFPRADGPPTSLAEDLSVIARLAPTRATRITPIVAAFGTPDLPAVVRHGDLWAGNLLVGRGSLTGVIDWDAWHPRAVPGADLLELFASTERLRARRPLGVVFRGRPWRSQAFVELSRAYGRALELSPSEATWDVVGVAWWAAKVAGTLRRLPERGADEGWLAEIVDPVLAMLAV